MPDGVTIEAGEVELPLDLVAGTLGLTPAAALAEMRAGRLTSVVEKGLEADAGRYRLSFFHGSRRARIVVAEGGAILQRSCVDFGGMRPPR